jgi:hypothetical protein
MLKLFLSSLKVLEIFLLSLCLIIMTLVLAFQVTRAISAPAPDSLISLMESHLQVTPGQTRVLPDCGCTVRYVGTFVHGQRYSVVFDRLD